MRFQYQKIMDRSSWCDVLEVALTIPGREDDLLISHAKLNDPSRHFPKVISYCVQEKSGRDSCAYTLILRYENNLERAVDLPQLWRGSPFFRRLSQSSYCNKGEIRALSFEENYCPDWETQYLIWPEGQIICLDEIFLYSRPLGTRWTSKPIGYFKFCQQYVMMFSSDLKE